MLKLYSCKDYVKADGALNYIPNLRRKSLRLKLHTALYGGKGLGYNSVPNWTEANI